MKYYEGEIGERGEEGVRRLCIIFYKFGIRGGGERTQNFKKEKNMEVWGGVDDLVSWFRDISR